MSIKPALHMANVYNKFDEETDGISAEDENNLTSKKNNSDVNVRRTKNQEAVATLLASFGEDIEDCSENLAKQEISFQDLTSLTKEDLILLGITDVDKQKEILETFKELPKQNASYENVVRTQDAQTYNNQILDKVTSHLDTMKTALSATNLKLQVRPSNDVIMEENNYASKFVLEALDELKNITEEIEDRLNVLEEVTGGKATARGLKSYQTMIVAGIAVTSIAIIWYWKFR